MTQHEILTFIRLNKCDVRSVTFEAKYFKESSPAFQLTAEIETLDGQNQKFATGLAPYSRHSEWQTLNFFEHLLHDIPIEKCFCIIDKVSDKQEQSKLPMSSNWKKLFAKFKAADIEHSFLYEWELYIFKNQAK